MEFDWILSISDLIKAQPGGIFIALGAVIGSSIAAIATLVTIIVSKENKVSEFRQQGIDSLIKDISLLLASGEMLARAEYVSDGDPSANQRDEEDREEKPVRLIFKSEAFSQFLRNYRKIKLRLNPLLCDLQKRRLDKKLDALYELLITSPVDNSAIHKMQEGILKTSRAIIRIESRNVREGEKIYRWIKFALFMVLVVAIGFGGYLIDEYGPKKQSLPDLDADKVISNQQMELDR